MATSTFNLTKGYYSFGAGGTEYGFSDGTTSTGNNAFGSCSNPTTTVWETDGTSTKLIECYTSYFAFATDQTSLTFSAVSGTVVASNLTGGYIQDTSINGTNTPITPSFVTTSTYIRWVWIAENANGRHIPSGISADSLSAQIVTNISSTTPPDIDVTETSSREYNPGATSYTMTFSNGTSGDEYQLRRYDAGAQTGTIINSTPATADGSGNFSITVDSANLATSGSADTIWYSLYARRPIANGGDNQYDYCNGTTLVDTLNLTRRPYKPTINNVTDDGEESASVGIVINVSGSTSNSPGTVDRLYLIQYKNGSINASVNRTWGGDGNYSGNFRQPRNTGTDTYYYRAYVQKSGDGAPYTPQDQISGTSFSDYFPSVGGDFQVGYIDPDTGVNPTSVSISATQTSASITINNVTAGEEYQLRNQTGQTQYQSAVANSTSVTITQTSGLPTIAQSPLTFAVYSRRSESLGGDNLYDNTNDNYTITRTDDVPNAFTLDTRSNQATGVEVVDDVQITGLTQEALVTRTGGTGTFAVGGSTQPSAGSFSTADKTITNNQYLWVKDTTSANASTTKSTEISIGTSSPVSSTFSYTTGASGDVTVQIQYDPENTDYNVTISPTVSGQDGSTTNTAYEVTAGTDVVFQNTSDPIATDDIVISGLGFFTNNSNVTIAQGGSATRTWDSGNLGNTVEQLTVATDVPVVNTNIYLKEPAVGPDLDIDPVSPANIDWDQTTAFNVTINNVTSGEEYRVVDDGLTLSLGEATATSTTVTVPVTLGNSTSGNGQLGLGQTKTYDVLVSRSSDLGGDGTYQRATNDFTITRSSQAVSTPTDITFSTATTNSNSTNVTVTAAGSVPSGATLQVRLGSGSWLTSPQTYNLTRGESYSFSARVLGFQGASTSGTYVESYTVPYRNPDTSVSVVVTTTIAANSGNQTVRVQNGSSLDTYSVTNSDGSVTYASRTGNGNMTLTAASPDELPASGSSENYRIRVFRPESSGGSEAVFITTGTNSTFTITRSDPTQPTVTIDADPGTRSKSVSLGVDAFGGTGSTFEVSEDNSNFVASGTAFQFTRGVNKTVYGRGVTDGNPGPSNPASRQLAFISPLTPTGYGLSTSSITAGATANITANISGGNTGDVVEVRTDDTNTALASGASVGSDTIDGSGNASITISSGEQPDVQGTTARYRLFVKTPTAQGGEDSFVDTGKTAGITRGTISQPNNPVIPNDTTTRSQSVSLTVTVDGGSGGVLELSENQTVWFTTDTQAFTFTRNVGKTIYARRRDGTATSPESSASRTLAYIPADTDVDPALSASSISPGATAQVTASVRNVTIGERLRILTTNNNTTNGGVGYNVGSASARTSTTVAIGLTDSLDELPSFSTGQVIASYKLQVKKFLYDGGSDGWVDTGNNFSITRRAFTAPNSIQFPSDPGTLAASVSLTVDIAGGAEGSLQISEDNTNWTTATSGSFEFQRNVSKTIYARRIDGTQVSSVTSSSFTLSFLPPNSGVGITPSTTSIAAGYGGTVTVAITGATAQDVYRLITTDTNTPQSSGHVVDEFTGTTASSFTIANNELPDGLNTSAGYRVEVRRPFSAGGDNAQDTCGTFNISRGGISQPTSIQFPADPGTASASVSLTVTIGGGSGGDLEISENNSTWFTQASRAFEFTRNQSKTIYARRNDNGTVSGVTQSSFQLSYLPPDASVSAVSVTIGASAGDADIVIDETTSGHEYQLRNQTGTVTYQSAFATGSSLTITQTGGLPSTGGTTTYQVFARRPVSLGGDNSYDATGSFYTVTRNAGVGGAPSTSRDHGNGKWVAIASSNSVAYATARGTTTITEQTSGGSTSTVLTTGSNPARDEFAVTAGRRYYANKPINFNRTGSGQLMVPLGLKGKEFGDYHYRYDNQVYYMYAETAVNVEVYDNVTGGITGTSTTSISVPANTVTTYVRNASNSSTWIFFASDGDMVMSKAGNGGDRHVMSPASDYIYTRRSQYNRATDNTAPSNVVGNANGGGVVYDTTSRVVSVAIGDGAGGDSEQGVGGQNLSNTYLWPWSLRDFFLTVPNTNTIHVESFNSGAWVLEQSYTVSGTTTAPATIRRDGDSGFTTTGTNWTGNATPFNSNVLWRFRGSDVFFLAVNDNSTDEEAVFGYTETVVTAPTDITFGSDPGTLSASVNITATAANGQGGLLEVSEDQTNWFTNGTAFQFTRNSPKTIYARRNLDGHTISASSYQESNTIGYLTADSTIGITPSLTTIGAAYAGTVTVAITGATAQDVYRIVTTDTNTPQVSGHVVDSFTGTTASSLTIANNELPDATDTTAGYRVEVLRPITAGGDGTTQVSAGTFNISRDADRNPETFTALAGNVPDADLSTQHYATFSGTTAGTTSPGTALSLGTTIDNGTSISVSNGQWSTDGTNWNSGTSTINENQSVYFRGQSASTNGTQTTHSLTIGDTTRSFTTTTFGDTFPDNYTNLAGNNIDADFNTVYYATFSTTPPGTTSPGTAFNVGTTVSNGTQVSVNNGEYRINNGSFTSTSGQINQNDDIYFRSNATASASGQSLIPSLTIGSISHSFQLKTGTVAGNTAGLAKGTDTYGVTIYGPDGTTEVWGTNVRQTNIIIKEYFTLPNGSSCSFLCADANDNTKVIISAGAPYPSGRVDARAAAENLSVSKTSTGFTVTNQDNPSDQNNTSAALAVRVIAARIS